MLRGGGDEVAVFNLLGDDIRVRTRVFTEAFPVGKRGECVDISSYFFCARNNSGTGRGRARARAPTINMLYQFDRALMDANFCLAYFFLRFRNFIQNRVSA